MDKFPKHFLLMSLFAFVCITVYGQTISQKSINQRASLLTSNWSVGASIGPTVFFGDIKQNALLPVFTNKSELRAGGAIDFSRQLSPAMGLRVQAIYAKIAGTKRSANVYFNTSMFEGNLGFMLYPVKLFSDYNSNRFADFYLIAGMGMINFDATKYNLSTGSKLAQQGFGNGSGIGGMSLSGLALAGFGVDFPINDAWSVRFETANRWVNSDLLDVQSGGVAKYDYYNFTSIGVQYALGKKAVAQTKAPTKTAIEIPEKKAEVAVEEKPEVNWQSINEVVAPPQSITIEPVVVPEVVVPEVPVVYPEDAMKESRIMPLEYRVQVYASSKSAPLNEQLAKRYNLNLSELKEDAYNNLVIYTIGSYETYEKALKALTVIRTEKGVGDAFVVAFQNGKRLPQLPKIRR